MEINPIYFFIILFSARYTSSSEIENHERDKRGLIFRLNSATGILVAIAIPLDLPKHEVFMSYNFEANYNMPTISQDIAPGIWQRLDLPGVTTAATVVDAAAGEGRNDLSNNGNNTDSRKKRNIAESRGSFFSRTKTYQMLESKLYAAGYNGTECLLRAICDNAATPVDKSNGILGDIIHIILSPSTSMDENLNRIFHEAEINGRQMNENCEYVYKFCPKSVFDRLSVVF